MPNAGKYFLEGFNRGFGSSFGPTYYSKLSEQRQIDAENRELQRQELERQQNLSLFEDLLRGQKGVPNPMTGEKTYLGPEVQPSGSILDGSFRTDVVPRQSGMSNIEKMLGLAQLPPNMQNLAASYWESQMPAAPTKESLYQFGDKVYPYKLNTATNQYEVDWQNPLQTKEKTLQPKLETIGFETRKMGDKTFLGQWQGYPDGKGGYTGKKWVNVGSVTDTDKNGNNVQSKEWKGLSKSFWQTQQKLKAVLSAGIENVDEIPIGMGISQADLDLLDLRGEDMSIESNLTNLNSTWNELIDNNMPVKGQDWLEGIKNVEFKDSSGNVIKKKGEEPNAETYYLSLIESYTNDQIDQLEYEMLLDKFRATYEFDPVQRFGEPQ